MARLVLHVLLVLLGVSAVVIGTSIFLLGPSPTGATTQALFNALTGRSGLSPPFGADADSELRFYAPFWVVYGGALVLAARDLKTRLGWVPWLAALFFAGGVGRLISFMTVGPPHPAFTGLMAIELTLPPVFLALWGAARRTC